MSEAPTDRGWAARIPAVSGMALGPLRTAEAVLGAMVGDRFWIRGGNRGGDLGIELRKIPGLIRFEIGAGDCLVSSGSRVPGERLPAVEWRPLSELLVPRPQAAALAAPSPVPVALRMVAAAAEQPAAALLLGFEVWLDWCDRAPELRLSRLQFAAAADGRVIVRGQPLPPLPGTRLTEVEGLLLPAGLRWTPAVDAAVLRELLALGDDELALLTVAASFERLTQQDFVRATRSAVRASRPRPASEGAAP